MELEKAEMDRVPEQQVIEHAQTEWIMPNVFAPKKHVTMQFRINYLKFNAVKSSISIPFYKG